MSRLHGRLVLVTGAAGGIGRAIAELFAAEEARVLAVDLPGTHLADTYAGNDAVAVVEQDVAAPEAPERLLGEIERRWSALDILINNAGICPVAPIEATDDETWSRVMEVNVSAMFRLCRALIPLLRESGRGRIVNTGSIMSSFSAAGMGAYAASKHAVAGLTKTLASELGASGVTANYLQPGAIVTGITRDAFETDLAFREFWTRKSAAGRLGQPDDVARVALFLASDDAAFVSGQGIVVDGGAMQSP